MLKVISMRWNHDIFQSPKGHNYGSHTMVPVTSVVEIMARTEEGKSVFVTMHRVENAAMIHLNCLPGYDIYANCSYGDMNYDEEVAKISDLDFETYEIDLDWVDERQYQGSRYKKLIELVMLADKTLHESHTVPDAGAFLAATYDVDYDIS